MTSKILEIVNKVVGSKPITAVKDGIIMIMPVTLVGSIFLLLANLPIPGYSAFMSCIFGEGWATGFNHVETSTFGLLALVAVFGIAYVYAHNDGVTNAVPAGVVAMIAFFIMNNHFIEFNSQIINDVISKSYLGGKGIIGAIIVGLLTGWIYSFCIKMNWKISLPEGVPPAVVGAFTSLIPFALVMTTMMILYIIFDMIFQQTFFDVVYKVLQTPLQGMTSTLAGAIIMPIVISLLWWSGIHGSAIVSGIMTPIIIANGIANQALRDAGQTLVAGDNAYIITMQFLDQYITVTGSGFTLGLVILMLIKARSTQFKELGKLSIIPGFFNINEPIIFGTPIVFNPYMFIPFVLAPLSSSLIVYTAIAIGFLPPFGSVIIPWTTPIIIGGFLIGGWKAALVQLLSLVVTTLIYFPFFMIVDKQAYELEK